MGVFARFFKSKFFIISLTAALLLSIIPGVLCVMGHGSYVRSALQVIATPFEWCFTKIGDGLGGYAKYFASLEELRAENAALRSELAEYEGKLTMPRSSRRRTNICADTSDLKIFIRISISSPQRS